MEKRAKAARLLLPLMEALDDVIETSDSSSSEEDDQVRALPRKLPKTRKYFELIQQMDQNEFTSHFRMGFDTFKKVVMMVNENRATPWTHGLTSDQRTLIALWYLGSDSSFRTVSQQFGVAMSTAHDSLLQVVDALLANISTIIKFPTNEQAYHTLADEFYNYKYPNTVGAIDGTLLKVSPPEQHRIDYFTRKYTTAVNLTAVCDARKKILNINVGQSGRCHDSHIFGRSKLSRMLNADNALPDQYHIIGDAAYGLTKNVMVPYPGDNLAAHKVAHNHAHSSSRMVVERCFADLKTRWLRLKCLLCDIELANKIIAACCCLHNLCVQGGDIAFTEAEDLVPGRGNHVINCDTAVAKRDAISLHISDN